MSGAFLNVFHLFAKPSLSSAVTHSTEVVQETDREEVWGFRLLGHANPAVHFDCETGCRARSAPGRMCLAWEQRALFRVGRKAAVGSVGYGKFNKDDGITALRNNVHMLKRPGQNATEAGPAARLQLSCGCSTCVCLSVHRGTDEGHRHFS